MSKGKFYFSKSLDKGLKILSLFTRSTPVLTQSEIAKTLGMNMTSTYRYINTLVELGYLEKDSKTKEIRPSILCLLLCTNLMQAADHLRMIREVVDQVHRQHNISIDVAYVVDDTIVRLYHREAEETLTFSLPNFSKNCLHNTALGKAYLAGLSDDTLSEKIGRLEPAAKTRNTIVDRDALAREVRKTRERQFSLSEEEYLPGLLSIGAPLLDPVSGKSVGAVSFDFSVLQHQAEGIVSRYGELIRETAATLSALLPRDSRRQARI